MLAELRGLMVFAHLVRRMSFTRAAEQLGMTRSAVSKHIARLEAQLGTQLLVRTTRKLALTEAGERVRPLAEQIAASVELSKEAARSHAASMAGHLRIAAPSELGRLYLVGLLARFLEQHPRLSAELVLGDAYVDLLEERIDVALRVGRFVNSSLVARRIAKLEGMVCASPAYLAQRGTPRTPADLSSHEWISHVPHTEHQRITLHRAGRATTVRVKGRFICNDGAATVAAAVQGFGLVLAPIFELAEHLRERRLVRVLSGWSTGEFVLHAVFPPRRHVSSKVRAFVQFVLQEWRSPPWRLL